MIGLLTKPIQTFTPKPWQVEPWRDLSPTLLLTGSAGGGKSRMAAEKVHGFCQRYPKAQGLVLRKTRESMQNSTTLFLERVVIGKDPKVLHVPSKSRFEYDNGSILTYGGMANEEQREQIRSVGQEGGVDIAWMEEANAFVEDDYNELLPRMRGKVAPWRQIILTTNPDAPGHWIYVRLIQGGEAKVYYSNAGDNDSNPDDYLAQLEKLTGSLKDRLARGLWVAAEGMYFEEWDPNKHIVDEFDIPADWTRWVAIDWGFADPFCALWFARDPETRRIYVYREIYARGLRETQQAQAILDASKEERISLYCADPSMWNARTESNRPSIASIYHASGVPIAPAGNSRVSGWQIVRTALSGDVPRLQILRGRAPNLVRTLPAMVHDPLDSEDLADKVNGVKTEDHAVDPFRYGLVAEAQPVQEFRQIGFRMAS